MIKCIDPNIKDLVIPAVSVAAKIASLVATKRKADGSPHDSKENRKIKVEAQAVNLGS
jgi:hypothetical protein